MTSRKISLSKITQRTDIRLLNRALKKLKKEHVEGLDVVLFDLKKLKEDGVYENLGGAYKATRTSLDEGLTADEIQNLEVFGLAYMNLGHPPLNLPPVTDLIHISHIYSLYEIIEYVYYMNVDKKLNHEDIVNMTLSGLDKRIIFALDKFDEVSKVSKPDSEFFKNLKKVKWNNNEVKKFFFTLSEIRIDIAYTGFSIVKYAGLSAAEDYFLELLAACSALDEQRNKINKMDIVRAYRTYIKLLNTDVSTLKAKEGWDVNNGLVYCENCNEYHNLRPGESPEDFKNCKCGGKFTFYESLEDIRKN